MTKANAKVVYELVPATPAHARAIGANPRPEDEKEILATNGRTVTEALLIGYSLADKPQTLLADGVPITMFGITPACRMLGLGIPWLLSSNDVDQHEREFIKRSREIFYNQAGTFSELVNFVDVRNTKTIRWLKWLGFTMEDPKPYGLAQMPFHRFYMRA